MKQLYFVFTFFWMSGHVLAQYNTPPNYNWVFGNHVGVNFSTGTPTSFTTAIYSNESCASVSNSSGQLLFYTDGVRVYNRLNALMPSGAAIVSYICNSTTQGALIVPSISNKRQYYIFSLEEYYSSPNASRLSYSIVDTSLAGGLGDLVPGSIGIPIADSLAEKMVAVASTHCSVWIIVHNKDMGEFYAYEFTAAGLSSTPVTSTVGTFSALDVYAVGTMAASPDGRHLVCNSEKVWYAAGCEIYDFDPATGIVSNCQVLNNTDAHYAAEFSPDSKMLYTANLATGTRVIQYDISLGSTAAIIASGNTVITSAFYGNQLKLGPDDKIYMSSPGLYGTTLDAITNPNVYGPGCNYVTNVVSTAPNTTIFGLPNIVVTVSVDTILSSHDTMICLSPSSGATIMPHFAGASYLWDDGSTGITRTVFAAGTYWVAVHNGCSVTIETIHVTTDGTLTPNFSYVVHSGCGKDGNVVEFTNHVTTNGAYVWDFGDGTPADTSRFTVSHTYAAPGVYSVTLTGSNEFCQLDTMIVLNIGHTIKADFQPTKDTLCVNELLAFNDLSVSSSPFTGYVWNFKDFSTDNTIGNVDHSFSKGGVYPVSLAVTNSLGCVDSVVRLVVVLEMDVSMVHDITICLGSTVPLRNSVIVYPEIALPEGSLSYSWNPATNLNAPYISNPIYTGLGITTYTLTATHSHFGCSASDTVRIKGVRPVPVSNVTRDITINYGESVQLNADSELFYRWYPSDGSLNNPNINNPVASPEQTTTYILYTYDVNSCMDSAFVTVTVEGDMTVTIPSAFTPNGDGKNDIFRPLGLKFQKLIDFRVYNRWGQQIFYSNNNKDGWDGTYNNEPQGLGVYNYMIEIARPGENVVYKGNVTLIR